MLETTPARVAQPIASASAEEAIPDEALEWEPLDLPRAVRSRRTFRIPVIVIAVTAAVGAYLGGAALLRLPTAHAEGARSAYADVLQETLDAVPALRNAAATLTGTGDDAAATATLVRIEGVAAGLREAAAGPDPLLIPGLPADDLDLLTPIRGRMGAIAERMGAITAVLTDTAAYRRAMQDMFLLPELPGPDEGPSVEEFSDRLSQMTAATVAAAALLPEGEPFTAHRDRVAELVAWLPEWQAAYLEALRDDDLETAEGLRAEATRRIDALHTGLDALLAEVHGWADAAISGLVFDIQAALVLTG